MSSSNKLSTCDGDHSSTGSLRAILIQRRGGALWDQHYYLGSDFGGEVKVPWKCVLPLRWVPQGIRSTPTEMQSIGENELECMASTGVNTPETVFPSPDARTLDVPEEDFWLASLRVCSGP